MNTSDTALPLTSPSVLQPRLAAITRALESVPGTPPPSMTVIPGYWFLQTVTP